MVSTDTHGSFYKYWGKAGEHDRSGTFEKNYHLLVYHCLDVASVGHRLLERFTPLSNLLSKSLGLDSQTLKKWITFFLALHDLGKFSEGFQNIRNDLFHQLHGGSTRCQYSVRHDSLGFALWTDVVATEMLCHGHLVHAGDERVAKQWHRILEFWARAATGHHGRPPRAIGLNGLKIRFKDHFTPLDCQSALAFAEEIANLLLPKEKVALPEPRLFLESTKKASWLMAGMAVLCDWIGSNEIYFPFVNDRVSLVDYFETALEKAYVALDQAGVTPPSISASGTINDLFPYLEKASPMQTHVLDLQLQREPQLHILEDLTGSGKTEAALALAHKIMHKGLADGIFVALPTMATANAMYERLSGAYRKLFTQDCSPSLVLAHSSRHLSDQFRKTIMPEKTSEILRYEKDEETAGAVCTAWLADSRKKALLADVGVGTLDQALLGVLPARHQALRLLGLCRKVLIVDEVHSCDSYMNVLLKRLLQFHAAQGGSAILLSATLPKKTRAEFKSAFSGGLATTDLCLESNDHPIDNYPLATHLYRSKIDETSVPSRPDLSTKIRVQLIDDEETIYQRIITQAGSGACVCWIRNTVADALTTYYSLLEHNFPVTNVILFHARYAMADRLGIESQVLRLFGKLSTGDIRAGKILVATQVVEQSLDLDFDYMVSDLAPIDLIIQRAGRLHRHKRGRTGNRGLSQGCVDHRGEAILTVNSPDPAEDVSPDWYSKPFPRASRVYPHHAEMWRTAKLLKERGGWIFPNDARILIEGVYGENLSPVPAALFESSIEAEGHRSADASLAYFNALDLEAGYADTQASWLDDTSTPTRLGAVNTTVRLGRWTGAAVLPWSEGGEHSWEMSQVNVRETLVKSEGSERNNKLRRACEQAKASMRDRGKWSILVPLVQCPEGYWTGDAVSKKGKKVQVSYSETVGLEISEKG